MKQRTIVIVGTDEAAYIAAKRIREISHDVRVVLIESASVDVLSLDLESRVVVEKTKGTPKRVRFDALIFCGGISTKTLSISGLNIEDIVSNIDNTIVSPGTQVAIIGCGKDGIAFAQKLKEKGAQVSIVEKSARILPRFSFEFAQTALNVLKSSGISVFTHEQLKSASRLNNGVFLLTTSLGRTLEAEIIVSAVGTVPNAELLEQAGAMIAHDKTVFVDEKMCTTLPSIYACGDAVSLLKAVSMQREYRSSASMKERGAQVAATNAVMLPSGLGDSIKPCAGTELIRIANRFVGRTGLSHIEARQHAAEAKLARATVVAEDAMLRLLASREEGTLLGAEIFGEVALMSQLDLLSMAVVNGLKASDLVNLDVSSILREAAERICSELNDEFESVSGENIALWLAEGRHFQWLDVDDSPSKLVSQFSSASHLPLKDLDREFRKLQFNSPVVLSCRSGRNALQAYRILKKQRSAQKILFLEGGSRSLELILRNETSSQEIV